MSDPANEPEFCDRLAINFQAGVSWLSHAHLGEAVADQPLASRLSRLFQSSPAVRASFTIASTALGRNDRARPSAAARSLAERSPFIVSRRAIASLSPPFA